MADFKKGTECPDCGEEFTKPTGGEYQHEPTPHDDARGCVRYLRGQLDRAMRVLEDHNFL